ncbi:MAG TPA: UrcA family protein [Steroidobacteraceae bacterium]|nr:UrcA family protein [Steroidobacteraceae bacterium]
MLKHSIASRMRAWAGAAAVLSSCLAGAAAAGDAPSIALSVQVNSQGLDLQRPADMRRLYSRLKHAAWDVCSNATRIGLEAVPNRQRCIDNAFGDAIRTANMPLLTQIYLATHTLQEAAARGIDVSAQVASLPPRPAGAGSTP